MVRGSELSLAGSDDEESNEDTTRARPVLVWRVQRWVSVLCGGRGQ